MCCSCGFEDVVLTKLDFDGNSYTNKFLKGRRYRLILDDHLQLHKYVQWLEKPVGGFDLIGLNVGDDTRVTVQSY